MIDLTNGLKGQKLVFYSFRRRGEEKIIHGHSFIDEPVENLNKSLITYFEFVNDSAKKAGVKEVVEFIEVVGVYDCRKNRKFFKEEKANA